MEEDILGETLIDWMELSCSPIMINKQQIATKKMKTYTNRRKRIRNQISWSNKKNQCDHPLWYPMIKHDKKEFHDQMNPWK